MTINVEDESRMTLPGVDLEGTARQVIEAALDFEGCPYETEVSLLLTDNEGIRVLNREHRDMDRPTDVLSFPMLHFETPADFSEAETEEADCFNPESGELVLGDIIISLEKVVEQAEKYGHSQKREYAFLIAHSMLHLMGYDHESPEEAGVMEARQAAHSQTVRSREQLRTPIHIHTAEGHRVPARRMRIPISTAAGIPITAGMGTRRIPTSISSSRRARMWMDSRLRP